MHKIIYLLIITLAACTQQKENAGLYTSIDFDITKESELGPDDIECVFIPLETTEESLLSLAFDDIQFHDDKIFIVNSNNNQGRILVFSKEGKFITQVGKIGHGPGEYLQPHKLHVSEDKNIISVADYGINKLIVYNLDNYQYLSSKSIPFNFDNCTQLSDKLTVWSSEGGLDLGNRKSYYACIMNEEMETVSTFQEIPLSNYLIGHTSLYSYNNRVYIGLPFSPFIYHINAEGAIPVWKLSFGKQKLPPKTLVVDKKENNSGWQNRVIQSDHIIAFHAHETSDCLGVSFYGKAFKRHLGFYDKRNKITHAYTAEVFMGKFHLPGVYDIVNTHNDYFVSRIEPRLLKKYVLQREDLRLIAEDRTEEDNPVLCLFKIKK